MLNIRSEVSRRSPLLSTAASACAIGRQRPYVLLSHRARALAKVTCISRARLGSITCPRQYHIHASKQADVVQHSSEHPVYNPSLHSYDELDDEARNAPARDVLNSKIRQKLRLWQNEHGDNAAFDIALPDDIDVSADSANAFTRLANDDDDFRNPKEAEETERDEFAAQARANVDDYADHNPDPHFLSTGDLVELEYSQSERESVLAVFVRRVGPHPQQAQLFTVHGKWVHMDEKHIQFGASGFLDPALITPMFPYLPEDGVTQELMDRAQLVDLSVPRHVSAPLVSRMLRVQRESEEIYRKHASTLDNAHSLLAHPTDLQFGVLEQMARNLLGRTDDPEPLSQSALFTVRKALLRAGFAFGFDRRSHRLTGFIQIRSKKQVETVEKVRNWIRAWQDHRANPRDRFSTPGAAAVHSFISKAQRLILKSRQVHDVTELGRVGPSKTRFNITPKQNAVKFEFDETEPFNTNDKEIIRFMEGWACSGLFQGLTRIEALPPLILQATKMYEDQSLQQKTGFTFLQEIGVLLPYENKVQHDQHLLLPTSQHSKPLEKLSLDVTKMGTRYHYGKEKFVDSMADLRKDWGSLPVFCIDGEGAQEIDDGISVEKCGEHHWIHVHIANPTSFFDKDHDLAKMARHMTETIYMPDKTFTMMPNWASQGHFSLTANRPCLTFSARMDDQGRVLEEKITPGTIRNVFSITPDEVAKAIGVFGDTGKTTVLTVGGELPNELKSSKKDQQLLLPEHIDMLKTIQRLAVKRQSVRQAAGGLSFNSHGRPDITVKSAWGRRGLGWDYPSRDKPRMTLGEPVIQWKSHELVSWFSTKWSHSDILVQEMMILACEIGAKWASDRGVPVHYRGSVDNPAAGDSKEYWRDVMEPAMEKTGGDAPIHIGFGYMRTLGSTVLTPTPLPHRTMGVPCYTKVTSPLRRYGDMIFHWQAQAVIREEARLGKSLIGSKREDYLPFTSRHIQAIGTAMRARETLIQRVTTYSEQHWMAQLLFRAHHYGELELPKTFELFVSNTPAIRMNGVRTFTKAYASPATMASPEAFGLPDARAGDWWEAELQVVDSFGRTVVFKPLRLISRWE